MIEELLAQWRVEVATAAIMQSPVPFQFITDLLFPKARQKPQLGNEAKVKIYKSSGFILTAITPRANRQLQDRGTYNEFPITLPRFALQDKLEPQTFNDIKGLEGKDKPLHLATKIGEVQEEHKVSYVSTIEYMGAGALFGTVTDGNGKVLFQYESKIGPVNFKTKGIDVALLEVDTIVEEELGYIPPRICLCSSGFYTKLEKHVKDSNLIGKSAQYVTEHKRDGLRLKNILYIPYAGSGINLKEEKKPHLKTNEAVYVPTDTRDTFTLYFGRANHMGAIDKQPTLFFSAVENLSRGCGVGIDTECKPLPVCNRPGALVRAIWPD